MDFKKFFRKDDKAVSPVIGVILMVAITVILAAAIGSSVFGQGTTKSAPQANFDIKAATSAPATAGPVSIKIEHLGGEPVHFNESSVTKVMASIEDADAIEIDATSLKTMDVGDVKTFPLTAVNTSEPDDVASGQTVNIKFIDVQTNQIICDKDVRF